MTKGALRYSLIHVTLIKPESPKESPQSSVFHVCRAITAQQAAQLTSQDISRGLYHGADTQLLEKEPLQGLTGWHLVLC